MRDRWLAPERSRRMAELFEGVSSDGDSDGYGIKHKPFGTAFTGGNMLRFQREFQPSVYRSVGEALGRQWLRRMSWKPRRER
jgi:hypothetical protein